MRSDFTYRPRHRDGSLRSAAFVTLAIGLILFVDIASGGSVRGIVRDFGSRIWGAGHSVGNLLFRNGYFTSRNVLESQINAQAVQIAQYQERAAAYDALRSQYDALAKIAHLASTTVGVTAPIVSSLASSPYGTFSIGAGSENGMHAGDLVLSDTGFVLGRITDVGAYTSLVNELFAPNVSTEALVKSASVIAVGSGGGNARMRVPRGIVVDQNDTVTASQFGGRPIGVVGHVEASAASAYSDVIITLPVNLNVVRFVYIVSGQ